MSLHSARSAAPSERVWRAPSARPSAAATPIAGAPRIAMSRIAAATSWWSRQRSRLCSAGRRRWSIITTTPFSHATVGTMRGLQHIPGPLVVGHCGRHGIQSPAAMVSVEQALEIVLRETPTLPAEEVPLEDALARVLARDVAADRDLPPFDRAAMDGYALRAADVRQAPVALEVVGEVRAGEWPTLAVGPGQAVRIMTGAPCRKARRRSSRWRRRERSTSSASRSSPRWPRDKTSRRAARRSAPGSSCSLGDASSTPPRSECSRPPGTRA
jgi:hypothetical protein